MIRIWGTFAAKSLSACGTPWSFLFPSLRFASERRAVNKKSPSFAMLRKRILLRSVADSNRRTRFCRPMPSHSANRPIFSGRCLSASWRTTNQYFPVDGCPPDGGQPTNAGAKIINIYEYLLLARQRCNTCHLPYHVHQVTSTGNDDLGVILQ